MKSRRLETSAAGVIEVGTAVDGEVYLSIEETTFGEEFETLPVVHFNADHLDAFIRLLKKARRKAAGPRPAKAEEPEAEQPDLPKPGVFSTRLSLYDQGQVVVGTAAASATPLLFLRMEKNTWGKAPVVSPFEDGPVVVHFTEDQFDALVAAGNRRFGR